MEQQKLPNTTLIIVFGIISIVTCCCYGIVGLLFGVIALILAIKATNTYKANPELYSDYANVKTGKILAIIGVILSILVLLLIVWVISIIGMDALQDEEIMRARMEEYFNK